MRHTTVGIIYPRSPRSATCLRGAVAAESPPHRYPLVRLPCRRVFAPSRGVSARAARAGLHGGTAPRHRDPPCGDVARSAPRPRSQSGPLQGGCHRCGRGSRDLCRQARDEHDPHRHGGGCRPRGVRAGRQPGATRWEPHGVKRPFPGVKWETAPVADGGPSRSLPCGCALESSRSSQGPRCVRDPGGGTGAGRAAATAGGPRARGV